MSFDYKDCDKSLYDEEVQIEELSPNGEALTSDVIPKAYEITINPDLETKTFYGDVSIHFNVKIAVMSVTVHCDKMEITNIWITLDSKEQTNIPVVDSHKDIKNSVFTVYPDHKLKPGDYILYMSFKNVLNEDHYGLYIDSYVDNNGNTQNYIMSHFQPNFARKAFPCFDDLSFHATFQLNISKPSGNRVVAISNMCAEKETESFPKEGLTTVHFMKTKPLPVNKLVVAVGKFSYIPTIPTVAGLYIAVYSKSHLVEKTVQFRQLAIGLASTAEKLFYLRLSLQKLDILGLPRSLLTSLEYFGLIVMNESYILISENFSTWKYLKSLSVTANKIGHVWISNFANLQLWTDFWLKQGLAGYLGHLLAKLYEKEFYSVWVCLLQETFPSLKFDGFENTYAVRQDFLTPATINKLYKTLIFKKSVAIMMMVFYGNIRQFRTIMCNYFSSKEKNLTSTTFYNIAEKVLGFNPQPVFDSFINQSGFPILEVRTLYGTSHVIEQKRFGNKKYTATDESSNGCQWDIPISYITENEPKIVKTVFMRRDQSRVTVESKAGLWILLNHKHVGYYRVNYSQEKWTAFAYYLMRKPENLEPEDRAGLIEDAFCLTNAGYFHYNIPFNLTVYLHFHNEPHCFPWHIISTNLYEVAYHFLHTTTFSTFLIYVRSLLEGSYDENLWEIQADDPHMEKLTKYEILNLGGWAEDPRILIPAQQHFLKWLDLRDYYEPNLLKIILKYGMNREGNPELWNRVQRRYIRETGEFHDQLWTALTSVNKSELIEKLLQSVNIEDFFQPEIMQKKFQPLIENNYAIEPFWHFLRKHAYQFISQNLLVRQTFKTFLSQVVAKLDNDKHYKEVKVFQRNYTFTSSMQWALESVKNKIDWMGSYYEVTCEWLNFYVTSIKDEK